MIYDSICSGIEAATVAWHPLGWRPAFFSEIEPFPRALLLHHYPAVPLHGDFTTIQSNEYAIIDVLVGGTPCQSFSVAGLRQGFADPRGNLTLEFVRLAQRLKPRWLVWENVPGVLSLDGGRAFGAFLGGLAECGYGFAYRVLDAQYFGVPQRRRRVFVVGYFGDWRPPAAVLFERESLRRDITPSRERGERVADSLEASLGRRCGQPSCGSREGQLIVGTYPNTGQGWWNEDSVAQSIRTSEGSGSLNANLAVFASTGDTSHCLNAGGMARRDYETETLISRYDSSSDGTRGGLPIVPITLAIRGREGDSRLEIRQDAIANAILTPNGGRAGVGDGAIAHALKARPPGGIESSHTTPIVQAMAVRRLTPRECERLQGFPDNYTLVPFRGRPAADGHRYKALGNSMAVPIIRWIGERIQLVESLIQDQ